MPISYKYVLVWAGDSCEDGWVFDGHKSCFKLLPGWATNAEAQAACENVNATLAVPTNSYVADVIVSIKALTFFDVQLNSSTL